MGLTLRRWNEADLNDLVKYANNANVARFLTNKFPNPYTEADGREFIGFASQAENMFVIEFEGAAVGSIGFFRQDDVHSRNAEIGYWLAEPFWGRGLMTQAIKECVAKAFEDEDIDRIFARPFGSNIASQRVLEKVGFKLEAHFEKIVIKNGELLDELVYAIRREAHI